MSDSIVSERQITAAAGGWKTGSPVTPVALHNYKCTVMTVLETNNGAIKEEELQHRLQASVPQAVANVFYFKSGNRHNAQVSLEAKSINCFSPF